MQFNFVFKFSHLNGLKKTKWKANPDKFQGIQIKF